MQKTKTSKRKLKRNMQTTNKRKKETETGTRTHEREHGHHLGHAKNSNFFSFGSTPGYHSLVFVPAKINVILCLKVMFLARVKIIARKCLR